MNTRNILIAVGVIALIVLGIIFVPKMMSSSSKSNNQTDQSQVTPPPPPTTSAGKERFKELKKQKRELVKELKNLKKDCEWQKKSDALEEEIEQIQDAIDNFDCDEEQAPAPAKSIKRNAPAAPEKSAPASDQPAPAKPVVIKLDQGYYEAGVIRFCVRVNGKDDIWLPQRLKMDLNMDVEMENNGIQGNNWVLTGSNGDKPDENKAILTPEGKFYIPAKWVEEIAAKHAVQPVAELNTTKTGWKPTEMRRDGNFFVYP